ncbi:MAG: hypothetical protein Q8P02_00050, partial [Candidatus Micrarchaeota archaeon]|nr:hypothetical protein [Candidatus Micrarchaeota archaeon]
FFAIFRRNLPILALKCRFSGFWAGIGTFFLGGFLSFWLKICRFGPFAPFFACFKVKTACSRAFFCRFSLFGVFLTCFRPFFAKNGLFLFSFGVFGPFGGFSARFVGFKAVWRLFWLDWPSGVWSWLVFCSFRLFLWDVSLFLPCFCLFFTFSAYVFSAYFCDSPRHSLPLNSLFILMWGVSFVLFSQTGACGLILTVWRGLVMFRLLSGAHATGHAQLLAVYRFAVGWGLLVLLPAAAFFG